MAAAVEGALGTDHGVELRVERSGRTKAFVELSREADLIVLGAPRKLAAGPMFAHRLVYATHCPVVVMPPEPTGASAAGQQASRPTGWPPPPARRGGQGCHPGHRPAEPVEPDPRCPVGVAGVRAVRRRSVLAAHQQVGDGHRPGRVDRRQGQRPHRLRPPDLVGVALAKVPHLAGAGGRRGVPPGRPGRAGLTQRRRRPGPSSDAPGVRLDGAHCLRRLLQETGHHRALLVCQRRVRRGQAVEHGCQEPHHLSAP